ncbi:MAG: DUF502 domain-containing protein [Planctomycetota bacterium]|nr:DUF502 domain-containing protein [Planctomycetota bacterium]
MARGTDTNSIAKPDSGAAAPKPRRKGSVAPKSIRGRIVAGVLLIIPLAVTAILIRYIYQAALSVGVWLVYWVSKAIFFAFRLQGSVPPIDPDEAGWKQISVAIGLTILMLYLLGSLGTNVVGRRIIDLAESLVERIPFVDIIYGAIKRMVQALSGAGNPDEEEKRVVLVNFPDAAMRAIAFMTNEIVDVNSGQRYATVYVPTTPNPTSGYMEIVPIEQVTETDLTMEQALSMILSGGATAPPEIRLSKRPPGKSDRRPTPPKDEKP